MIGWTPDADLTIGVGRDLGVSSADLAEVLHVSGARPQTTARDVRKRLRVLRMQRRMTRSMPLDLTRPVTTAELT